MNRRIGIFGGSFDPIHLGHLWIAEAAREQLSLDEVRFVPAATSPLKPNGPIVADADRMEMVRLAISGHPDFQLDDREMRRGEISYTVDTVAEMKEEEPAGEFVLIIGSDSLATFDRWREPGRLLDHVTLAVIQRAGDPAIDFSILKDLTTSERRDMIEKQVVIMPLIEVSSTDLRSRIGGGKSIRYQVPAAVRSMIEAKGLYVPSAF